jgi:hypothetical protein
MAMTAREWLKRTLPSVFGKPAPPEPPVIMTEWGPVTETARLQVEVNMMAEPEIKARVENMLIDREGSVEKGLAEARRRYPRVYENE